MLNALRLGFFGNASLAALIVLACGYLPNLASAQSLKIASEGYYAPFNYIDDDGELAGFDIDIANALCDVMEVSCEFVQNDWDALIPGLVDKQYDAIVASMSITPERENVVAFTLPYYSNMLTFVGSSGSNSDVSPSGLNGKKVGVLRSTVSSEYLETEFGDVVSISLFDTQEDALSGLVGGAVDLVLGDNLPLYDWLQSDEGQDHEFVGEFIDIDDRIGIAVRQEDFDLMDQINGALIEIIENGTYQEINAKYFPFSIYF
ncbi:MAG: transporter substrate-binding domain-containing protein [Pseudomonadota bacterium]